jgi:hypothetical protein
MKNSKVSLILGIVLFFLVISVIYFGMFLQSQVPLLMDKLQILAPLVIFTGFFLFLIGAVLVALFLKKKIDKR